MYLSIDVFPLSLVCILNNHVLLNFKIKYAGFMFEFNISITEKDNDN